MKPIIFFGSFCLSLFLLHPLLAQTQEVPPNTLSRAEANDGWQLLFNGTDLSNWEKYGKEGLEGWEVQDQSILCKGLGGAEGGDLITKSEYDHFDLTWEWKISNGGNSGLMFHVSHDPDQFPNTYETGPEYQMLDNAAFPKSAAKNLTGANYDMHEPFRPPIKAAGEWNLSRIRVQDGEVTHWLNDRKILTYTLESDKWEKLVKKSKWKKHKQYGRAQKGRIALQDHDHPIKFRNLKIKDLGSSIYNGKDLSGWEIYGTEKWFVEEGDLICESGPDKAYGYLATDKSYTDFDLNLEFRQESNGNSGVFFRSSIEGTKISGWQVEVAPPNHDTGGVYESYGRGWLIQIPEAKENILMMGSWNKLRIKVRGSHVQTWLNGTPMVDFKDEKIGEAKGSFALQIHDGGGIKVRWRNIRVIELETK